VPRRSKNALRLASVKAGEQPSAGKDVEVLAVAARRLRVINCEKEVQAALKPILEKYRCRLGTTQQFMDGRPGPIQIIVAAND
jgi:hypothetical protein